MGRGWRPAVSTSAPDVKDDARSRGHLTNADRVACSPSRGTLRLPTNAANVGSVAFRA